MILTGTYDPILVALSVAVAVMASYAALDLGSRLLASQGLKQLLWLAMAAVAMGGGIWSMHFIAMLAFVLPIPVEYDFRITGLSLLVAILATGAGLYVVAGSPADRRRLVIGGALIGSGIVAMHYTGMSAMLMQCSLSYEVLLFIASIAIAVGAATSALWLAFRTPDVWQRLGAAVLMGAAISGMHYTGMAAAIFSPTTPAVAEFGYSGPVHTQLALSVAALTFFILFIALFASVMDRHLVHEREETLIRLYRETPLPLHSVGLDGRLQKVSDAWISLLGYARNEVIGREITEFMSVESATDYRSNVLPVLFRGKEVHEAEVQFVKKTGDVLDILLSARRLGKPDAVVGGLIDVTARKRAEDALHQAQRLEAIGQITGGVAHDFNNLLMVMSGSAERIRKLAKDASFERPLDMMSTAIKRAQSLIGHLLSFSRRQTLEASVIDLADAIPRVADTLTRSLRGDIEFLIHKDAAACTVNVNPGELELALLNLGVNARDAMPNGGTINLSFRCIELHGEPECDGLRGSFALIEMKDTGSGISPEILNHVFEPFFTTKAVGKGTGLGLSQVYGFAKQSGGTSTISSKPGFGTAVRLYLPLTEEMITPRNGTIDFQAPDAPQGRALLVEDAPEVAVVIAQYLADIGYSVDQARDGTEALKILGNSHSYDLLVTDILMPGLVSGIELARIVRRHSAELPILLTTGFSEQAQQVVSEGFVVINKPYSCSELQSAIFQARSGLNRDSAGQQRMQAAE